MLLEAILKNASVGAKWGLRVALVLCAWVLVLAVASFFGTGSPMIRSRSGQAFNPFAIVVMYLIAGMVSGAIVGAMRSLLRWKSGATIVGITAAIPTAAAIVTMISRTPDWGRDETVTFVILSLALGAPGGIIIRAFLQDAADGYSRGGRRR